MPPKSKPSGQSKAGAGILSKSGGMQKSQDRLERSVAPTTTADPDRTDVNKELNQRDKNNLISQFQNQLELKKQQHNREIQATLKKIHQLRSDNERIQRQQVADYGLTLDMMEELKVSLDKTKSHNDKLHEDMLEAKDLHDKIEMDLKATQQRFDEAIQEMNKLEGITKLWEDTQDELLKSEERCITLSRNNRKLRIILLKNHIDPSTDPREFSRELPSVKMSARSNKIFPEISPKRPTELSPKRNSLKTRLTNFFNASDVETSRKHNKVDIIRRSKGLPAVALPRENPEYLGMFTKRRLSKQIDTNPNANFFRSGTNLPRILFG